MRAKYVKDFLNEGKREVLLEDIVNAICEKLAKQGKSGDAINPSNWRKQTERGEGIITREFFNQKAGITATVKATYDSIIDIVFDDEEDGSSPFAGTHMGYSLLGNIGKSSGTSDWASKLNQERHKEDELLSKQDEYNKKILKPEFIPKTEEQEKEEAIAHARYKLKSMGLPDEVIDQMMGEIVKKAEKRMAEIKGNRAEEDDDENSNYSADPKDWYFDVDYSSDPKHRSSVCLSQNGYGLDDNLGSHNLPQPVIDALNRAGIHGNAEMMEAVWEVEPNKFTSKEDIIKSMENQGFVYSSGIF